MFIFSVSLRLFDELELLELVMEDKLEELDIDEVPDCELISSSLQCRNMNMSAKIINMENRFINSILQRQLAYILKNKFKLHYKNNKNLVCVNYFSTYTHIIVQIYCYFKHLY